MHVQGRRDNELDKPNGVAVGREGQIYIADREIVAFKFNIQYLHVHQPWTEGQTLILLGRDCCKQC